MAKWQNRGKEFEKIGRKFQSRSETIYIYGAGENGKELYTKLNLVKEKVVFIDADADKQKNGYLGRMVAAPTDISEELLRRSILIIAASVQNNYIILDNLMKRGIAGDYVFEWRMFMELYLPIYIYYVTGKIYFQDMTLVITDKCTLRCKHCAAYVPYMSDCLHRDVEDLKRDIDELFAGTDFIWDLILTGGEPFLYPHLKEVLIYLEKYQDHFDHIQIICNGTVLPAADILDLLESREIFVFVSDYRGTISNKGLQDKIEPFADMLREHHIKHVIYQESSWWVDFGFLDQDKKGRSPDQTAQFFDQCHAYCRAFYGGGYIWCNVAFCADKVLNHKVTGQYDADNFFIPSDKAELLEWSRGFNEKGYLELCRYCNGHITVNRNKVITAEQISN